MINDVLNQHFQSHAFEYVDLLFCCIFPLTRWSPAGQRPGHSCQRGSSLLHLAALPASQREQQTTAAGTCQVHPSASLHDLVLTFKHFVVQVWHS